MSVASRPPVSRRPCDIGADGIHDPSVELAWYRADLRIACLEFLIGLLATACPPKDDAVWRDWWDVPPSPKELDRHFSALAPAFVVDGEGPCFCQDLEDFPGEPIPIERLLIDAPGENAVRRNTDLIVKRDRLPVLGRAGAAMALYTLQTFAPSGGAGHRTSVRGGGPLTTLVLPPTDERHPRTLWHLLWANVPNGIAPTRGQWPNVFPWLAPTRRSDPGGSGTALGTDEAHPLQAFWGMPRRIRLDFRPAAPGEVCALTGNADRVMVSSFRTRPWGVQYVNAARFHPLTPTYRPRPTDPPLAVHPQTDGISYRNWARLVEADGMQSEPAASVKSFLKRKPLRCGKAWSEARLLVAGYDMENMKARAFVEAEMPFFVIESDETRRALHSLAHRLAQGASETVNMLCLQLRQALHVEGTDRSMPDGVRTQFFDHTTDDFWTLLRGFLSAPAEAPADKDIATRWLAAVRWTALSLFDEAAPFDPQAAAAKERKPPPIVAARRNLCSALHGYGKSGEALFQALALNPPIPGNRKKARAYG